MTFITRWQFATVTDRKMAPIARSITYEAEIARLRKGLNIWRWIAWSAIAQAMAFLAVILYYGVKP